MARSDWEYIMRSRGGVQAAVSVGPAPSGASTSKPGEIVVKVASHIKTVRGTKNVANYIARHGGRADREAFDECGARLSNAEIERYIENDFGLKADRDNLSPAGRTASGTPAFKTMTDREKYNHRQSTHLILSLPAEHQDVSDEQLHQIARDFLEPFREADHKALYAIHRHQQNPHIHFVISFRDAYRVKGSTLNMTERRLDAMREHGAEVARENGIAAQATRRESREDLVHRMMKGVEPLRTPKSKWGHENRMRDEHTNSSLLERQAPNWYERWGTEFEHRRTGALIPGMAVRKAELPPLEPKVDEAVKAWADQFKTPDQARQSFLEMAAENERLAFWYAVNRPQVFGHLPELDRIRPVKGEGYEAITMHQAKLDETWKRHGRAEIEKARLATPEHVQTANRQLREINKKLQAPGQAVKAQLIENFVLTKMAQRVGIDVDRITFEKIQRGVGKYPVIKKDDKIAKPDRPRMSLSEIGDTLKGQLRRPDKQKAPKAPDAAKQLEQQENADLFALKNLGHTADERAKAIYESMDHGRGDRDQSADTSVVRERKLDGSHE